MSTLLNKWLIQFNLKPSGIVHVGAHLAQERDLYRELNIEPVLWIEAHPAIFKVAKELLSHYSNQRIINAALWNKSGELIVFTEAGNEGSSSSLLDLGLITAVHPQVVARKQIVVRTSTLAEVLVEHWNFTYKIDFLLIDTQGAESKVIEGLGEQISQFKYLLAEVSTKKLYKKAMLFNNFIKLLDTKNFQLLCSHVNSTTGWGDALFVRKDVLFSMGIVPSKNNNTKESNGLALVTRLRAVLIRIGIPNSIVARINREFKY